MDPSESTLPVHSSPSAHNPSAQAFADKVGLELTAELNIALTQDGIETPTEIQCAVIPAILEGRPVVVQSGTGTGKTLAYLLPVLQVLRTNPNARAVLFAPSAELAMQTARVAKRYKAPDLEVLAVVAGANKQRARVTKSTRLVIGTPGRLLELFDEGKLKGITCVVLDESEPILGTKEAAYLRELLSRPHPHVQLIFAGATYGLRAEAWIRELMGDAVVRPKVKEDPLRDRIRHHTVQVQNEYDRDARLARLLGTLGDKRAIVFFTQPNLLRHAFRFLTERGIASATVSQERNKQQCQQAIADFARSRVKVLLTNDAAATGLDVPDVPWVIHYELPNSALAYVHRAGRTGRAGRSGGSIVLTSQADRVPLQRIAKELDLEFTPYA